MSRIQWQGNNIDTERKTLFFSKDTKVSLKPTIFQEQFLKKSSPKDLWVNTHRGKAMVCTSTYSRMHTSGSGPRNLVSGHWRTSSSMETPSLEVKLATNSIANPHILHPFLLSPVQRQGPSALSLMLLLLPNAKV